MKKIVLSFIVLVMIATPIMFLTACGGNRNGDTTPTVTLSSNAVTINNTNLTRTVTVGGTATNNVTLDYSALPAGVSATVSGTTITITGIRPTGQNDPAITGAHNIVVSRQDVTQTISVTVNLTTSWTAPTATITLDTNTVSISNYHLNETVNVGGTAEGAITFNRGTLPSYVNLVGSSDAINISATRPNTYGGSINAQFIVSVIRGGVTESLTIYVNLTTTHTATPTHHNIIPPTGTGFTFFRSQPGSNTVEHGATITLRFAITVQANFIGEPIVEINGQPQTPTEVASNSFWYEIVIHSVSQNIIITVAGIIYAPAINDIVLPSEGFIITRINGEGFTGITQHDIVQFTLEALPGYSYELIGLHYLNRQIVNRPNLAYSGGVYIITNVRQRVSIAIQGFTRPHNPFTAPWDTTQFRNNNVLNNSSTNFALNDSLENLFNTTISGNPRPYLIPNLRQMFIDAFVQGFSADTFSKTQPFSAQWLQKKLDEINYINFAVSHLPLFQGAFFQISHGINTATPGTTKLLYLPTATATQFIAISIHEVGHVLGLGESLTELWTSYFVRSRGSFTTDWLYYPMFDEPLLERVGHSIFWREVFTSKNAYVYLWETNFPHFVFDELIWARHFQMTIATERMAAPSQMHDNTQTALSFKNWTQSRVTFSTNHWTETVYVWCPIEERLVARRPIDVAEMRYGVDSVQYLLTGARFAWQYWVRHGNTQNRNEFIQFVELINQFANETGFANYLFNNDGYTWYSVFTNRIHRYSIHVFNLLES